ncbi:diphosphate--fructose-6-phosphate 1-phosphotransferase, partial [Acidobacteria bacterium AH-259-O06]|nr:diphosphate--fructose-6-phosphate 1-phosphotransferase [Acidobacteria bacterium AH-259-O06]
MPAKRANVVIAQGGGPTAVINSSLYGVVRGMSEGLDDSARIWGARGGIVGVFDEHWVDLCKPQQSLWDEVAHSPGAALGSCRKRLADGEAEAAVRIFQKKEVRYFFYIGGNDSMDTALQIGRAAESLNYELHTVGIPKTIDNDLMGTDHCPGFGSASRYFAQSCVDLGADVRSLPTPVSILEVMGRNAGWLTAATMLARDEPDDAPHLIYVPEVPLVREKFLADVRDIYDKQGWVVVTVSEGLKDENGQFLGEQRIEAIRDGFDHALPGDVAATLARLVASELEIRARSEKPGLCGRASALLASTTDRTEALNVAHFAALKALEGETRFMAALHRDSDSPYRVHYETVPLTQVANLERLLPFEYLTPQRNDLVKEYRNYVQPLIGGSLLRHAH